MSERITKKQLKEDAFLESVQHVLAYARDHVTVVVLGVLGFIALVVLAVRIGGNAAGIEPAPPGNPEAQQALVDARGEFALGRMEAGTQALDDIRRRWRKDDAGREATYVLANAYFEAGEWDKARQTFEDFLKNPLYTDLLRDGARLGIAACREESGDLEGAIADYRAIWGTGLTPGTRIQAALAASRCSRELGHDAEAEELLRAVVDRFPDAPEARDAEFELMSLDRGNGA